ncbi:hypothetical protein JR316_0003998 [Psilocybe cubensis]|uniref:Uncharacterized protein n=2 Tax=Psilocybe cubensis TaxID=181762 RepID=A0ACB8H9H1_PSICU|nr:hypothetical protein JR316_0003998 [Psilocybe cubensis]KAH9484516.1 hypothetical protein JR316_0003998 [Psilocybe cubensis]
MSGPQSQFSTRKGSIEESFRPFEHTKRVQRLYVPENPNDPDRVFSEYDWKNQTYTTTLRSVPQCPPAPRLPHIEAFESINDANSSGSRSILEETVALTSRSKNIPRQNPRSIPDEALISSMLLSTSPLSISCNATSSYDYPSSPIARTSSLPSPLEQSIIANAELDRDVHFPSSPSVRSSKRLPENRPRRVSFARRSRSDSRKTMVDEELSGHSNPHNSTAYRRNRSCTWSSDVTAVEFSEDSVKLLDDECVWDECDDGDDDELPEVQTPEPWEPRGEAFRRRTSLRRRRPSMQSYLEESAEEDIGESLSAEDFTEEVEPRKETRVEHILSAIHYRYVSMGLRVQLAMHRTEKKVVRKLSSRRKN